jgi:hypothetical protein
MNQGRVTFRHGVDERRLSDKAARGCRRDNQGRISGAPGGRSQRVCRLEYGREVEIDRERHGRSDQDNLSYIVTRES